MGLDLHVSDNNQFILDIDTDDINIISPGEFYKDFVTDYNLLTNKPSINNVILVGDKSWSDLGLVSATIANDGLMSAEDKLALERISQVHIGTSGYPVISVGVQEVYGHECVVIILDDGTIDGRWLVIPTGNAILSVINQITDSIDDLYAIKQDVLTFDIEPTENSINPVTSGGIYEALEAVISQIPAEVNVQADWNQTDSTASDYIKNKPEIPIITAINKTLMIR